MSQKLLILGSPGKGPLGNRTATMQELPSGTKGCKMCICDALSTGHTAGCEAIFAYALSPAPALYISLGSHDGTTTSPLAGFHQNSFQKSVVEKPGWPKCGYHTSSVAFRRFPKIWSCTFGRQGYTLRREIQVMFVVPPGSQLKRSDCETAHKRSSCSVFLTAKTPGLSVKPGTRQNVTIGNLGSRKCQ